MVVSQDVCLHLQLELFKTQTRNMHLNAELRCRYICLLRKQYETLNYCCLAQLLFVVYNLVAGML